MRFGRSLDKPKYPDSAPFLSMLPSARQQIVCCQRGPNCHAFFPSAFTFAHLARAKEVNRESGVEAANRRWLSSDCWMAGYLSLVN
jgi:hypothetical protein